MLVIIVYDVGTKRNPKVLKTCRKYLPHVQKSVFEGYITEGQLNKLKNELRNIIDTKEDSIIIYRFDSSKYSAKEYIGVHDEVTNIL